MALCKVTRLLHLTGTQTDSCVAARAQQGDLLAKKVYREGGEREDCLQEE